MKQKSLQRITALLLAMLVLPQAAWARKGSGTSKDPYLIEYGAELDQIRIEISQGKWAGGVYIELQNDIVLSTAFKPLGTTGYPFCGQFMGNDHNIKFLDYNYTTSNQGLFGVTRSCVITDFTITGTMTSSTSGLTNIGSVVGCAQIGTIVRFVKSSVNININGVAQKHIGGIVGHYEGGATSPVCGLDRTEYSGVINAGTSTDCIGGIVGFVHADSNPEIIKCNSIGSIYSTGSTPTMGGILGYNNNENNKFSGIKNCFSRCGFHYTGSNKYVSGLAGRIRSNADSITNNCALTDSCGGKLFNTDTDASFAESNELVTYAQCRSGYVTYTLNPEQSYYSWQQKINSDNYPELLFINIELSEHNLVYKVQDKKCTGANYGSAYYSNSNSYTTHHNGSWVERVEPTCTTAGNIRHYHCNDCGKNFGSETDIYEITDITLAALGHTLSSSWSWGNDGHSATCTETCKRSGCTHSAKATATYPNGGITSKVKTAATCYSKGTTTYSAQVLINNANYTSTKDVQDIAMTAHTLKSTWTWSADGHSAKCTDKCSATGCTHSASATATYPNGGITSKVKTAATCYSKGTTTYSAQVTVGGTKRTSTKDVQDIAMIAHTLKTTWTWSDDGHSATCTDKCSATGCTHSASATATYPDGGITRSLVSAATCSARASYKYSASITVNGNNRTDSKTVSEGDKLTHNFSGGECTVCHEGDYLTFTSTGASTIALYNQNSNAPHVEYSLDDGGTWTTWDYSAISLADGKKVLMRGNNPNGFSNPENLDSNVPYSYFRTTGKIAASGSLMSLIDGHGTQKVIPSKRCFKSLFSSCELTTAPQLLATTLTEGCYDIMFSFCTSLTQAPALPADSLATECYYRMFNFCTSLTTAPALPADTLAENCYSSMFSYCTSLTTAPELPATTLAKSCYDSMFSSCTSLAQAPELPATTLAESCYKDMFNGCSKLSKVEVNFTEWSDATRTWLVNVAATGEFICPSSLPQTRGTSNIPVGWTITVKAPAHITGDVNGDGDVDVVDINCIIDIMLGSTDSPYRNAADVNGDGAVDIVDINCIIQILLGE